MDAKEPTYFDIETVSVLREILEDAWACLRPDQQANISRSLLAERILKAAATGERDRERLLDAALDVAGGPHLAPAPEEDRNAVRASQARAQARSPAATRTERRP
jgi:hypothetical protein